MGGDGLWVTVGRADSYFNPRLPHGRRPDVPGVPFWNPIFQSTPPSREATAHGTGVIVYSIFQSTPPSREATLSGLCLFSCSARFQSTPPSREATQATTSSQCGKRFQSTPPSREATRTSHRVSRRCRYFNPRLPHGRRLNTTSLMDWDLEFQSTPPSREATVLNMLHKNGENISIHASLTGGDQVAVVVRNQSSIFQS